MEIERQLAKHLKRLNKAIQKLVAESDEFEGLRRLLKESRVELAVYVVPLLKSKTVRKELRFELTDADRLFLKQAGIRFDAS